MPISLYKDLGKYGKSKGRGLESLFMAWLWHKTSDISLETEMMCVSVTCVISYRGLIDFQEKKSVKTMLASLIV